MLPFWFFPLPACWRVIKKHGSQQPAARNAASKVAELNMNFNKFNRFRCRSGSWIQIRKWRCCCCCCCCCCFFCEKMTFKQGFSLKKYEVIRMIGLFLEDQENSIQQGNNCFFWIEETMPFTCVKGCGTFDVAGGAFCFCSHSQRWPHHSVGQSGLWWTCGRRELLKVVKSWWNWPWPSGCQTSMLRIWSYYQCFKVVGNFQWLATCR